MNKNGDLPVTILVIGVFAVCTLALLSFFYSSYILSKSLEGTELIEEVNARVEAGKLDTLYLDLKENKLDVGIDEKGFHLFKEKIVFSVEYNP